MNQHFMVDTKVGKGKKLSEMERRNLKQLNFDSRKSMQQCIQTNPWQRHIVIYSDSCVFSLGERVGELNF